MRRLLRSPVFIAVVAALTGAGIAGGISYAVPGTAATIYACTKKTGVPRLVAGPGLCNSKETAVSWNEAGPQGPPGPQGVQGAQGTPGTSGQSPVELVTWNTTLGMGSSSTSQSFEAGSTVRVVRARLSGSYSADNPFVSNACTLDVTVGFPSTAAFSYLAHLVPFRMTPGYAQNVSLRYDPAVQPFPFWTVPTTAQTLSVTDQLQVTRTECRTPLGALVLAGGEQLSVTLEWTHATPTRTIS